MSHIVGGIGDGGEDILPGQVRILVKNNLDRDAVGQGAQHMFQSDAGALYAGLSDHDRGIARDAGMFHVRILSRKP